MSVAAIGAVAIGLFAWVIARMQPKRPERRRDSGVDGGGWWDGDGGDCDADGGGDCGGD